MALAHWPDDDGAELAPVVGLRPCVCRRTGCTEPAGADGLCTEHERHQLTLREHAGAAPSSPWPGMQRLLAALNMSGEWRKRAACRGMTGIMYPGTSDGHPVDYTSALALCATCPVVDPCRAAGAHEPHGAWGGTTPADRGYAARRRGP